MIALNGFKAYKAVVGKLIPPHVMLKLKDTSLPFQRSSQAIYIALLESNMFNVIPVIHRRPYYNFLLKWIVCKDMCIECNRLYFSNDSQPKMTLLVDSDDAICAIQILVIDNNFFKGDFRILYESEVPMIEFSINVTTWTNSDVLNLVLAI